VLLALQRTHGNRYVQRVVAGIQAKLKVGQPGDKYEQEADRVADAVMRMPAPGVQRQVGEEKEEEETLHAKPLVEEITPQKAESSEVPPVVHEVLHSSGQPLDPETRSFLDPRFGHDFSQVRVHADAKAAESARTIDALAFTLDKHIVFGAEQYRPTTSPGRQLLAHELAHVVQQLGVDGVRADYSIQRQPEGSEATGAGPGPVAKGTGNVSVYVGKTMTSEAALRQIYRQSAREVSEEALRMIARGSSIEDAARWANQARNGLKVLIRARGSPIIRGFAEARNIKKYGNRIGPTFEELIRQGKTPEDIIGSAGKASIKVNRVTTKFKVGGRFFIVVDLAIVTWEVSFAPEGERLRTAVAGGAGVVGAVGGGWAGVKVGAAVGSVFGPIGTGLGGIIGGISGAFFGGWLGRKTGEKAYDLVEDLVNPPSGSLWDLQTIVIDGIEEQYIRTQARRRP